MFTTVRIEISDASQVAQARRMAVHLAGGLQFDDNTVGKAALLATEAASNIFKHAGRGELLFNAWPQPSRQLEIIALDSGPGFDTQRASQDGYSTAGTMGGGLGAMKRVSSQLDMYSQPKRGSVIRMALRSGEDAGQAGTPSCFEVGAVSIPHPGETLCGDAWCYGVQGKRAVFSVVDGLGHGIEAHRAAQLATQDVCHPDRLPEHMLQDAHAALRATRGAALAVAVADLSAANLQYAGIGNITSVLSGAAGNKHLVSLAGIVGHNIRKIQSFTYPWGPSTMLTMYSDGLATHWNLDQYPGLHMQPAGLIAAVLYRDHARGRDDVTVLVAKSPSP